MRISIAFGFFLPVPPERGGATEKIWWRLGQEFAAQGHEITLLSRQWPGFPDRETSDHLTHLRLHGHDHSRRLFLNLWRDLIWSWRLHRALPPADVVVVNAVALPVWLGRLKPSAGKVVVVTGRVPKGQYRCYRRIARVMANSTPMRDLVARENSALLPVTRVYGCPINWSALAAEPGPARPPELPPAKPGDVTIGFVGRLHAEKGLHLLAEAAAILARRPHLPPWRLVLCGPAEVARGGSGEEFVANLRRRLAQALPSDRIHMLSPRFSDEALASVYRQIDVFCLPSLAEQGETFGVAAAEAMAAGCATVVSALSCFRDFLHPGQNGLAFDHRAADAATLLASQLERLIVDAPARRQLAAEGRRSTQCYDYPVFAGRLLADFAGLAGS